VRHVTNGPEHSGLELLGFPPSERLPQLRWIGPNYAAVLVHDLTRGLLRQDPGTQVMGVRCDSEPVLRTSVDPSGVVRGQDATFALQVFVRDGRGRLWRLRGRWTYVGRHLGTPAATLTHYWELFDIEGG
jgi:hypothetical protein